MRIVFAGFQHETNTFSADVADDAAFAHGGGFPGLCRGAEVTERLGPGANIAGAGFLAAARAAGAEVVPVLWCAACPSGPVARDTYERIATEIVEGVRAALPADAVYLDLHGAQVAAHLDDGEGALLDRLRAAIGPDLPVIVSLDLHANVTERMVALADALVAFRTYPHVDMARTGARAFALLQRRIALGRPFARALRRIPYLVPICWQATDRAPAGPLYARLGEIEAESGAISLSFAMGFAAADIAGCSPTVWGYAESEATAEAAVDEMTRAVLAAEAEFAGPLFDAEEAVERALALNAAGVRPVVIADAQDNPGAGGSSDTTGLLCALVAAGAPCAALGVLHDPEAAAAAHAAGLGARLTLALGGHSGLADDAPFVTECEVVALSDGRLHTRGPFFGDLDMDLGPAACLCIGGVRVVVASRKAQMADREMFRFLGIEPEAEDILVVKSAIHFRADFAPIAGEILTATAPGAMLMRTTGWRWRNLPDAIRMMPCGPTFAEIRAASSTPL